MKKHLLIALLSIALSACTTHWTKTGATTEDFARDDYACQRDALGIPDSPAPYRPAVYQNNPYGTMQSAGDDLQALSNNLMNAAVKRQMYERCMQSKGWQKE